MSAATSASERARYAAIARLVAEEAGALVARGYRSRPHADRKGRHDLVTEFDRASEELLISRLALLTPNVPVVGEEHSSGTTQQRAGLVWYVDPLDGTTNFVHGHPFWCVSVGLCEDDRPIAGAVVAPSTALAWVGYVDPEGRASVALRNGQPCAVSVTSALENAMVATGFPAQRDRAPHDNFASFMAVKRTAQAVRRCGSAAMDLCFVADGTYDGYWERSLHAWDTVAGSALVEAAGGKVTALDGGAPNHHVGHIVASNGALHAELVGTIPR
ncbi:Inositol-1-monophosphatase [Minicystis rosea]|nr:Inositol-1-monophosphatase [Minicystis rosea]